MVARQYWLHRMFLIWRLFELLEASDADVWMKQVWLVDWFPLQLALSCLKTAFSMFSTSINVSDLQAGDSGSYFPVLGGSAFNFCLVLPFK